MIITIAGKPGSGKSTAAKMLAQKLKLKHYSIGDLRRSWAAKQGMTLAEFNKKAESEPKSDMDADAFQAELGRTEDNFIIDSRLGFHFIPHSVKIFLDVSEEEGALRIMNEKRRLEQFASMAEAKRLWRARQESDRKRYRKYYKLDPFDLRQYDLVVDTTTHQPEDTVKEISAFLKAKNAPSRHKGLP
ncbi:MAG: cytidylate kinase family protein [Nanoarchaeota archaeon]